MKKILSLFLLILMLITLAACGGGGSNQSSSQPSGSSGTSTGAPPPGQPTMNVTMPGPDSNPIPAGTEVAVPANDEPQYGGVCKMITNADTTYPFGLPWNAYLNNATQPIVPFGEALVLESTGGDIYPWLATDWVIDPVKKEIRLNLREDVWFSDGSKFNAEVVEWFFTTTQEVPGRLNPAVGWVEAIGEYAIAVHMGNDVFANNILNILASHNYAIVSKENYEKNGEDYAGEHPVGTGPFIMSEKNPGVGVKYVRNDNYWQEGKPYLDGFEFVVISDAQTQINAMMAPPGPTRVDVLNNPGVESLAILSQNPELDIYFYPSGVSALWPSSMNEDSPFADIRVRQAMMYAIDREALSEARGFGYYLPATQFVPKGYYGHFRDERDLFAYNPEKAKQLLAEAGYPNGFKTPYYATNTADRDLVTAVTSMLGAIGIECEMDFRDTGAMSTMRNVTGWEGIYHGGFGSLASMPSGWRLAFDPQYTFNKSTRRPDGYAEAFEELLLTINFEQRTAERCHELLYEDMSVIPMLQTGNSYVTRSTLMDAEYGYWAVGTQWLPSEMWFRQ